MGFQSLKVLITAQFNLNQWLNLFEIIVANVAIPTTYSGVYGIEVFQRKQAGKFLVTKGETTADTVGIVINHSPNLSQHMQPLGQLAARVSAFEHPFLQVVSKNTVRRKASALSRKPLWSRVSERIALPSDLLESIPACVSKTARALTPTPTSRRTTATTRAPGFYCIRFITHINKWCSNYKQKSHT